MATNESNTTNPSGQCPYESLWESIRADWVNGNQTDARNKLYQMSKFKMWRVISAALDDFWCSTDSNFTHNGALTDLREILSFKGGNND